MAPKSARSLSLPLPLTDNFTYLMGVPVFSVCMHNSQTHDPALVSLSLSLASPSIFNCLLDVSTIFHQYYTASLKTSSILSPKPPLPSDFCCYQRPSCLPTCPALLGFCFHRLFPRLTRAPVSQLDPPHGLCILLILYTDLDRPSLCISAMLPAPSRTSRGFPMPSNRLKP